MLPEQTISQYGQFADDISQHTGLDKSLILGIIAQENVDPRRNNPFGISPGGQVAAYPDMQTGAQAFVDAIGNPVYRNLREAKGFDDQVTALGNSPYNPARGQYADMVAAHSVRLRAKGYGADVKVAANDTDSPFKLLMEKKDETPASPPTKTPSEPAADSPFQTLMKQGEPEKVDLEKWGVPQGGAAVPPKPEDSSVGATIGNKVGEVATAIGNAPNAMQSAFNQAYTNHQPILTPQGEERAGPLGAKVAKVLDYVTPIPGALFAGAQAGVSQIGEAVSPGLGRDLAVGMEVAPVAKVMGEGAMNGNPVKTGRDRPVTLPPDMKMEPRAAESTRTINEGLDPAPSSRNPNVPPAEPELRPSDRRAMHRMSPQTMERYDRDPPPKANDYNGDAKLFAADRARWEQRQLETPKGKNTDEYVHGERPTLAEQTGDANLAAEQAALADRNPGPFRRQQAQENSRRLQALDDTIGDKASLNNLIEQRKGVEGKAPEAQLRAMDDDIAARKLMQQYRDGLVNSEGVLQFKQFDKMMNEIVKLRKNGDGTASLIGDPTMRSLFDIRHSLARQAQLEDLAGEGTYKPPARRGLTLLEVGADAAMATAGHLMGGMGYAASAAGGLAMRALMHQVKKRIAGLTDAQVRERTAELLDKVEVPTQRQIRDRAARKELNIMGVGMSAAGGSSERDNRADNPIGARP